MGCFAYWRNAGLVVRVVQISKPADGRKETMKLTFATAYVALIPWVGMAQNSPAPGGVEPAPAVPSVPAVGAPVSVPVPVVRVPSGPAAVSSTGPSTGAAFPPGLELEGAAGAGPGMGLRAQLGWSSYGVELREPTVTTLKTNRNIEVGGVLPRVTRPERKGFGGFLAGFANLFNPFAPTAKGVESRNEHWYDGGVQSAPLPRGLRDERSHEPKTAVFSTEFGRGRGTDAEPEAPTPKVAPATPVQP